MNAASVYIRESQMDLLRAWRTPGSMVPTLILPLAFYSLFGVVLAPAGSSQGVYMLATYGVFASLAPCLFGFGAGIANDRDSGILGLKQASPLPATAFLVARLATAMTFTLAVLAGLYAIAILGAGVRLPAAAWAALVAVHLATVVPICLLGLYVGLRAHSSTAIAISNILYFGLSVLSGLWIPIFEFPRPMQAFSTLLPTSHLAALALAAAGQRAPGNVWVHVAACLMFTALAGAMARRGWVRGLH
jgi:ABC-2 type transport system permease protein